MNKTTLNSQKEKHSMLSLRRATSVALPGLRLHLDFYPRSPCGERRNGAVKRCVPPDISIHALLAESDYVSYRPYSDGLYFYPRSPCGERPPPAPQGESSKKFLSTLSLRRATAKVHKTVGHFCAYETTFMGIASSC